MPVKWISRRRLPDYKDQITHVEETPAQEAAFAEMGSPLPERLSTALAKQELTG